MKNKYIIITRDWKGNYSESDMEDVRGYHLIGGEEEIKDGNDCYKMIFSKKPSKFTVEDILEIDKKLYDEDVYRGCHQKFEGDPIIED